MLAEHADSAATAENSRPSAWAERTTRAALPIVRPVALQSNLPQRRSLVTQVPTTSQPSPEDVLRQIPDPTEVRALFAARLKELEREAARRDEQRVVSNYRRMVDEAERLLAELSRPDPIRLSLAECIQRAIEHSYAIRIEAYNPAISQTQLVEAEAAFDAVFFLDSAWQNLDAATPPSQLAAGQSDIRSISGGIRKLLPTGMQVSTVLSQNRRKTDLSFQTLNPAYSSSFTATITQPLLRGFGLDYNRSQVNIQRAQLEIAREIFLQRVRDTLQQVEQAYWRLAQARRSVSIFAASTAQNFITYENMKGRLGHDATPVEVANSESRWRNSRVTFLETIKNVRDAEDVLKLLMNDPELLLSRDIELIPTAAPVAVPFALDHFAEVRAALDARSEIRQARATIEQTRIQTAAAKNQSMPQLDLNFNYEVQGIGSSADASFDNLTTNRFRSFTVSVNFSYPFGNRARRAAYRRAQLQESQAVVGLNQVTDGVVQEVNNAIRTLQVRYSQISPQFQAVLAAARNLRALQARTQAINPNYLETELSGVEQLANGRNRLLQVITDYNVGVVDLERAKGTLLQYNNVVVTDQP